MRLSQRKLDESQWRLLEKTVNVMIMLMSEVFDASLNLILADQVHQAVPRLRPGSLGLRSRRLIRRIPSKRCPFVQNGNEYGSTFAPLDRRGRLHDSVPDETSYRFQ